MRAKFLWSMLILAGVAACTGEAAPEAARSDAPTPGLSPVAALGERLFRDESLSASGRLSCQTCHRPEFAHAAPPAEVVSAGGPAMDVPGLRNSPSIRYASFTPPFGYDEEGTAFGGFFRDGRVPTLAEQAKQPFLDPREMANPTPAAVIGRLRQSPNAARFREVFGVDALDDPEQAFARLAAAIAQFEVEGPDFHRFDSKYDAFLAGETELRPAEERGLALFEDPDKGNCAACHPSRPAADGSPPLFTDFTYDNVGLPRNPRIAANADPAFFDLGLCGPERKDLAGRRDLCGAFKVPTLRNVARTPPYFHNGAFDTLREAVDFYARRDTHPEAWYPKSAGGVRKFDDLPAALAGAVNSAEVPYDRKAGGRPALTAGEIDDVVAFLRTLDDGYNQPVRINTDQLARAPEKPLARAWLIAGDEALLTGEAADAVRARARAEGYAGRELFVTDRGFDWSGLRNAARSLSLFAERRILEVRMPSPRPGKEGAALLAELAADAGADNLLLVVTTRPEREAWSSAWLKAFEKHGVFVQSWPVEIKRLPQWIAGRAAKLGLVLEPGAAELLAERVEGNLLAAQQEIEKLALLHPGARLGVDAVQAAVANSARYDVFQLGEAALEGDAPRSLRILEGLRAEGAEPPLVLWALCRELRALADERNGVRRNAYGAAAERRAALVLRATRRTAGLPLTPWFHAAALIDRQVKGQSPGEPWTSLTGLVAAISGARLPPAMLRG